MEEKGYKSSECHVIGIDLDKCNEVLGLQIYCPSNDFHSGGSKRTKKPFEPTKLSDLWDEDSSWEPAVHKRPDAFIAFSYGAAVLTNFLLLLEPSERAAKCTVTRQARRCEDLRTANCQC